MLHFSSPTIKELDLSALGLWDTSLSTNPSTRVVLSCIPEPLVPAASNALLALGRATTFKERCGTWEPRPGSVCASTHPPTLHAAALAALPPGYTLTALQPSEAPLVDSLWQYRKEGTTIKMVEECIASRPSVCVRVEGTGEPVCWSVLRSDCSWGLLYTVPEHRKRGLSKAAMLEGFGRQRAWAEGLAGEKEKALACSATPYVHIAHWNKASEGVFRSLDFHATSHVTWVISTALAPRWVWRPLRTHCEREWGDLLGHINTSYRADDAFFVDQERTNLESLKDMAKEGTFFVGYECKVVEEGDERRRGNAGFGLSSGPVSLEGSSGGGGVRESDPPAHETRKLLVSVYLKVTQPPPPAFSSSTAAITTTTTTPFSADTRKGGGESEGKPTIIKCSGLPPPDVLCAPPCSTGPTCSISLLTVAGELKKRGCAQRALDFSIAMAKQVWGCAAVEVYIVSVKPWLLKFYEHNDFKVVGADAWPAFLEYQLVKDCFFHQARLMLQ